MNNRQRNENPAEKPIGVAQSPRKFLDRNAEIVPAGSGNANEKSQECRNLSTALNNQASFAL